MATASVQSERVLVIPTESCHRLGHFQGFSPDGEAFLNRLLESTRASYRPRHEVEQDPSFKQLIPYVILRHTDPSGRSSVFQYTRGKGQGEGRLHSLRSVGIGGHISADDAGDLESSNAALAYAEGMRRELAEEVIIESEFAERCVGLINDDLTEVGRVHLGVVHILDVEEPRVSARERDIVAAGFAPVVDLLADLAGFETWSQICLQALFGQPRQGD